MAYAGPAYQSSAGNAVTVDDTLPITKPSGVVAGDLLVAFIDAWNDNSGEPITARAISSSGWTELTPIQPVTYALDTAFWKIAGDSEPASYDFVISGGTVKGMNGGVLRIDNAGTSPVLVSPTPANGSTSVPNPPASGTVKSADYLALAASHDNNLTQTPPTNYTERVDVDYTAIATRELEAVTSEDPGSFGTSSAFWSAFTILVRAGVPTNRLYFTATTADTDVTADQEKLLADVGPASGTIVATTGTNMLIVSTAAGVPASASSWDTLAAADCKMSLNVTANTGYTLGSVDYRRLNASLAQQSIDATFDGGWSSTTGTGVKTYTPPETVDLGTAGATDRYSVGIQATVGTSITISLGQFSWIDMPWDVEVDPILSSVASDTFTRSVSGTLGSSSSGDDYVNDSGWDVDGSVGHYSVNASNSPSSNYLNHASVQNTHVIGKFRWDRGSSAGGHYAYLYARYNTANDDHFRIGLEEESNGALELSGNYDIGAGYVDLWTDHVERSDGVWSNTWFWVEAMVTGVSPNIVIKARYWEDGTARPGWQRAVTLSLAALDAGGKTGILVGTDDAVATRIDVDDLEISQVLGVAYWTKNTQGTTSFNGVATDGTTWVAVGDDSSNGGIRHTTDPTGTWTSNNQGTTPFLGVATDGTTWVAVGFSGLLYYATDPTGTWTSNAQGSVTFNDVATDGTTWVAVGDTGTLYYATDPTGTWTSNAQGTAVFRSVATDGTTWVAVGVSGTVRHATDPTGTWTSNTQGSSIFYDVATDGTTWVAVGGSGLLYHATDPTGTWTSNNQGTPSFTSVATDGTTWVAVGTSGGIRHTTDPTGTWASSAQGTATFSGVATDGTTWVAVGSTGTLYWADTGADPIVLVAVSPTDDVTTTGWSSTPLWSKIDEDPGSPDATVITATAS